MFNHTTAPPRPSAETGLAGGDTTRPAQPSRSRTALLQWTPKRSPVSDAAGTEPVDWPTMRWSALQSPDLEPGITIRTPFFTLRGAEQRRMKERPL
jgi:hypothetical protein